MGKLPAKPFLPGNPGGPGRMPRVKEDRYLNVLKETCPLDRWKKICERHVSLAEEGDYRAMDFLRKYLLPPVQLPTPPTLADGEVVIRWHGSERTDDEPAGLNLNGEF